MIFSSIIILVLKFVSIFISEDRSAFKSPSLIVNNSVFPKKFLNSISVLSAKNENEESFNCKSLEIPILKSVTCPLVIKLFNELLSSK